VVIYQDWFFDFMRTMVLTPKNCPDNCWGLLGSSLILLKTFGSGFFYKFRNQRTSGASFFENFRISEPPVQVLF
jgi:hypothetical protein